MSGRYKLPSDRASAHSKTDIMKEMRATPPIRKIPAGTTGVAGHGRTPAGPIPRNPQPYPQAALPDTQNVDNPVRKLALYAAWAMIFTRLTILPELIAHFTGANTFLLYLFG